jgi:hypothetical protein
MVYFSAALDRHMHTAASRTVSNSTPSDQYRTTRDPRQSISHHSRKLHSFRWPLIVLLIVAVPIFQIQMQWGRILELSAIVVTVVEEEERSSQNQTFIVEFVEENTVPVPKTSNHSHSEILRNDTSHRPTVNFTSTNIWDGDSSSKLPAWLRDYMAWHRETRQKLNEDNWQEYKYFLLRCVAGDAACEGASDRLKTLPVQILLASQARRLFFIHWSRPAPLEEFLVPPEGGLDWTLPPWLADKLDVEAVRPIWRFDREKYLSGWHNDSQTVIRVRSILYAHSLYDEQRSEGESTMWEAYHDIWKAVFIPAPNVQARIDQILYDLGLTPNNYVAAHVRAVYAQNTTWNREEINAVNCAVQLAEKTTTETPIFFASDLAEMTRRAIDYGQEHRIQVVGRVNVSETMHLDRGRNFLGYSDDWKGRPASDFYDTFVDLYLLALAKCSSFGTGGYGSWGAVIGPNSGCSPINHRKQRCNALASTELKK